MNVVHGHQLGMLLASALGLKGVLPAQRIVIVADIEEPARVYVKGFVTDDAVSDIVQAVADVTVDDEGNVTITPLAPEADPA